MKEITGRVCARHVLLLIALIPLFGAPRELAFADADTITGDSVKQKQLQPLDPASARREPPSDLLWYDAQQLRLEGMGFNDPVSTYARLPARAEGKVTHWVWGLCRDTAGICVRFKTDSTTIAAIWDGGHAQQQVHMAATGVAGLDLYVREDMSTSASKDEIVSPWKFAGLGRPSPERTLAVLSANRPGKMQEYLLYFPLYHTVSELRIGIGAESKIMPAEPRPKDVRLPIVFYGTSITQGGCASRAGMCHPAILGRWLDREVINLGFNGSGKSEPEMAEFVADVQASVYVLEPLPNMTVEQMEERLANFVRIIRKRRPRTPIVLTEHVLHPSNKGPNEVLRRIVTELKTEGVANLHLMPATDFLAGVENGTVDGVHPTDLGFLQIARAYYPVLKKILEQPEN